MDTTRRLRAIQQPSRVERLLVAFAFRTGLMGLDAYMLRDKNAMPQPLQGLILQATANGRAWCCWKDDSKLWLLTGDMPLDLSRQHGSPVLRVELYGEDGALKESDSWVIDRDGQWRRGAETEPSSVAGQRG